MKTFEQFITESTNSKEKSFLKIIDFDLLKKYLKQDINIIYH